MQEVCSQTTWCVAQLLCVRKSPRLCHEVLFFVYSHLLMFFSATVFNIIVTKRRWSLSALVMTPRVEQFSPCDNRWMAIKPGKQCMPRVLKYAKCSHGTVIFCVPGVV